MNQSSEDNFTAPALDKVSVYGEPGTCHVRGT